MAVGSFRRIRGAVSRSSTFRLSLLMGTALALPAAASAENVVFNGPGEYSLTRTDTVAGGPRTVDIITDGTITLDLTDLTVDNSAGNGAGVSGDTISGAGAVNIKVSTVTATGTGSTFGVRGNSNTGAITINAGSVTSNGNTSSRAISATTSGGDITINSTVLAAGGQRGIFTGGPAGTVTVTSKTATANGNNGSSLGALFIQGNIVNITSDVATLTNADASQGSGIYVGANTLANIKSNTVTTAGTNQAGIYVNTGGDTIIDSGTVTVAGNNPYGIAVFGTKTTNIKSTQITGTGANGGVGIYVSPDVGQADGTQAVTIASGSIDMSGAGATGIQVFGRGSAVGITSTGTIKADNGILVTATTGATTIDSNIINAKVQGINVQTGTGAVTIKSGTLTNSAAFASAIAVNGTGPVTITSGSVKTTGEQSGAIAVNGTVGALSVDATSVETAGLFANGIDVRGTTGAVSVKAGTIKTTGTDSRGIYAQSTTGAVTIDSGTIATTGDRSLVNSSGSGGIFAFSQGGAIKINSTSVTTAGGNANGISAVNGVGSVNITSGTISTAGANNYGILVTTVGDATITSGTISATGSTLAAIDVMAQNAKIVAGTVTSTLGSALNINTSLFNGGTADISVASITSDGAGKTGVTVGASKIKLNLGTVVSTGSALVNGNITTRADAVSAFGFLAQIDATIGSVTKIGTSSDAVRLTSSAAPGGSTVVQQQGSVSATITGAVSSTGGNGVFISSVDLASLNVAAGASVTGSTNGVNIRGLTNTIVNAGTISNTGTAPTIVANGKTSLDNSGTINAGSSGGAVRLGNTDDLVTLRTGSAINGTVVGGGGVDQAVLNGTIGVQTTAQTVAAFVNFTGLTVAGGYWTAGATPASFANVTINNGATLEVAGATAGGLTGVVASNYVADGTLAIRSVGNTGASVLGTQTVSGAGRVLFVGGTSTLDGTNSIATTGGIAVDNGATVVLTGTQGGALNVLTGGTFSIGNGGTSGLFTGNANVAGTLIVNHSDDYSFDGALTGAGTLVKDGAGKLTLGTGYAFTGTTNILGGSIRLAGAVAPTTELDLTGTGTLDFSGSRQVVAELQGNSPAASISVAQGGALTVNQTTSTAFAGAITGDGSLAKTGSGTLNLTGNSTYTGPTTVTGGKLAVNGSIVSPVTVSGGGKLGGTGRVGNVTIGAGGAYAPGNSIGTQNVAGNVVFASGSTYEVETNADGRSDRIIATGTANIATGTTVAVLAEAGNYNRLTSYNILSATGGVTGTFTNVTSNFAFLTPSLSYTGTAVTLRLLRNDVSFASLARTPNQLAVANAIAAQGFSGSVFNAAIMLPNGNVPGAYSELSGELFAAVPSVLIDQSRRIRGSVLDRAEAQGEGWGIWGQAGRAGIETDATGNVAATATDRTTVLSGVDYGMGQWRVGFHAGYIDSNVGVKGRASQADVHTKLIGAYGRWSQDALTVKIGGDYSWHDVDTTRSVSIPGLNGQQRSGYDATSQQLFGEVSYTLIDGPVTAAPFGGLAYVRTHADRAVETGNAAALTVASRTRDIKLATAGWHLGGSAPIGSNATLLPHLTASAQYAWGDLRGGSVSQFGGAGQAFGVSGARLAQATYGLDGGVDVQFGKNVKAGIGGFMSTSKDWSDFGGNVSVSFAF